MSSWKLGLTNKQIMMLLQHDDSDNERSIMAERLRKVNRMKWGLPPKETPEEMDELLKLAREENPKAYEFMQNS